MIAPERIFTSVGICTQKLLSSPFYLRISEKVGDFCNVRSKLKNKNSRNGKAGQKQDQDW